MRHVILAGALIPFVASVVFHLIGPSARPAHEAPHRPGLAFDQYLVDLPPEAVKPAKYAYASFAFTNVGGETVRVKDIKPSCGCLNPRLEKREYRPGERGEFHVRVMIPNEEPGPKEYTIDVLYEDPQPRTAQLVFKVVLPDQRVIVRPRVLGFQMLGETPLSQEIFVTDFRSQPLSVTAVECKSPFVTAQLGETQQDDEGNQHTRLTVTAAGKVPPGVHWADLIIRTDDATYATLQVPLQLQGPVRLNAPPTTRQSMSPAPNMRE